MRTQVRVAAPLSALLLLAGCGSAGTTAAATASGPVATVGIRACRASDVEVTTEPDGATGETLRVVRIVARPGVGCRLGGYPRTRPVTDGPAVPVRHDPFLPAGLDGEPFVLTGDRAGVVVLGWRMNRWCAPPVTVDRVELSMPGGGTVAAQGFGRASCDTATFPDEHSAEAISVGRFLLER